MITFHAAQLRRILQRYKSVWKSRFKALRIRPGTFDRFPGMEKQVVLVSMVRNNRQGKMGFAKRPGRINVAFSRAQELLVIIGSHVLFTGGPAGFGKPYRRVSEVFKHHGGHRSDPDFLFT